MKRFVSILIVFVMLFSFGGSAYAEIIKLTPSAGFVMVDTYTDRGDEDFILIYYSRNCYYSQKLLPVVEEYGEENDITTYGVDYNDGRGMSVAKLINSNVTSFPVIVVYNGKTKELSGLNEVHTEDKFVSFVENELSASNPNITLKIGSNKMICNGNTVTLDVPATIIDGRTMVPLRAIFEALGADVKWDGANRRITATRKDKTVEMFVDNNWMYINNESKILDVPPIIKNDRTLVPVRAVSEAFNCTVDWDGSTGTVTIK